MRSESVKSPLHPPSLGPLTVAPRSSAHAVHHGQWRGHSSQEGDCRLLWEAQVSSRAMAPGRGFFPFLPEWRLGQRALFSSPSGCVTRLQNS